MAEALELVEDIIKEARAMACDDQLQIMLSVQKACILYMLGNYEASIQCLADPHTRVCSLGDIWLELRVLSAHPVRACALVLMSLTRLEGLDPVSSRSASKCVLCSGCLSRVPYFCDHWNGCAGLPSCFPCFIFLFSVPFVCSLHSPLLNSIRSLAFF